MGGPCKVDGQVRDELDNFHRCQIEWNGRSWPSSEHVYQASKYPLDSQQRETIQMSTTGMESWQLGQTRTEDLRSDWEEAKVDIMYQANLVKFEQNPKLRSVLANSSDPIEAQGGLFWKTWNEVLLERIREELRGNIDRDTCVLAQRISAMEAYRAAAKSKSQYGIDVATKYASRRMPIPALSSNSADGVVVAGAGEDLDGEYNIDLLVPEVNGYPHFFNRRGGHLYLGLKHGGCAWVLDESFSPGEATGAAFIPVKGEIKLPLGQLNWQWFDGRRHVDRSFSIHGKAHPP